MHKMMTTQTPGARGPRVRFGTGLKKCGSPKPGAAALYRISSVRAAAPPPVFLKENRLTIWGPGEPRGRFCILLSLRAETRTKGCGRAFDVLFRRTAFFMRGQPAIPVFFRSGLMATPFLDDKKAGSNAVEIIRGLPRPSQMLPHLPEANRVGKGKEAPRGSPLGTPRYFDF